MFGFTRLAFNLADYAYTDIQVYAQVYDEKIDTPAKVLNYTGDNYCLFSHVDHV